MGCMDWDVLVSRWLKKSRVTRNSEGWNAQKKGEICQWANKTLKLWQISSFRQSVNPIISIQFEERKLVGISCGFRLLRFFLCIWWWGRWCNRFAWLSDFRCNFDYFQHLILGYATMSIIAKVPFHFFFRAPQVNQMVSKYCYFQNQKGYFLLKLGYILSNWNI